MTVNICEVHCFFLSYMLISERCDSATHVDSNFWYFLFYMTLNLSNYHLSEQGAWYKGFEFLMVAFMKSSVFWNIMPSIVLKVI
jgi:hypothetical protein